MDLNYRKQGYSTDKNVCKFTSSLQEVVQIYSSIHRYLLSDYCAPGIIWNTEEGAMSNTNFALISIAAEDGP